MNYKNRLFVLVVTILAAILSLFFFYLALINTWFGTFANVGDMFCETTHSGLIKQPANTWSNLAFTFGGVVCSIILFKGKFNNNKSPLVNNIYISTFFCVFFVFLGPASMAMHATMTYLGGFFDILSMFLIASFFFSYSIFRFFSFSFLYFLLSFVISLAICIIVEKMNFKVPIVEYSGSAIFALFLILGGLFEFLIVFYKKIPHQKIYAWLSLFSILISFVIWNFSKTDAPLCDPSCIVQGHAIWHILDALSLFFLFRYFVSQKTEVVN